MRFASSMLLCIFLASISVPALTAAAAAQIVLTVGVPPPPLPEYDQPVIAGPGYIWVPGYWAFDDDYGYYWVPGTWVLPPQDGLLWTPGYWAYEDGNYVYYEGYWGPEVGYYGGIDYGYGYEGDGYDGGYWQGNRFFYNTVVNNIVGAGIANFYNKRVAHPASAGRVSYNGGEGGLTARPTQQQLAYMHGRHIGPTDAQREYVRMAGADPALRESQNKGLPPIAATSHPGLFQGQGVIAARRAGQRPNGQAIPLGKNGPNREPGTEPGAAQHANPAPPSGAMAPGPKSNGHPLGGGPQPSVEEHRAASPHPRPPHPQPMMAPHPPAPHPRPMMAPHLPPHPSGRPPGKPQKH